MLQRMIRAARLDSSFYEEVEANPHYTREAFFVVLLAALAGAIGSALDYGARGVVAPILGAIVGWVIWSAITLFIGTTITKGPETRSDMGEMLRTLGYAHSPLLLSVFSFLPGVGALIQSLAQVWMLIAGVVAIRQALDFTTMRAVITVFLGWLVVIALTVLLGVIFVGLAGVAGAGV